MPKYSIPYEGKTYSINPDTELSPEEQQAAFSQIIPSGTPDIAMTKQAQPVLKEQPSAMESLTSPGGMLSPENTLMLTGGAIGTALGTPLGPPGMFLGGVLGAGGAAALGRGWEMLLEQVYGPHKEGGTEPTKPVNRSGWDAVGEMGDASQRGMVAQAVGEGAGGLIGKAGKSIIAPFASKMGPEAQRAAAAAKTAGIDITPAQTLDSGALSRLEGVAGRGITGADTARSFAKTQAEQSANAVYNIAESMAPGLGTDAQTVENFTKEAANGRLAGMKSVVDKLVSQVSGGKTVSLREAGETVKDAKDRLFTAVKAAGGKLYDAVRDAAGESANSIQSPNFQSAVTKILQKESELSGVQLQSSKVAAGASKQLNPAPAAMSIGDQVQAKTAGYLGDDLPQQIIAQYGLDKSKTWTLDALREWQSRLGYLSENAATPKARRDFSQMFAAVSSDITKWGESLPNNVNTLLKTANDFWRTKVADVYYNRLVNGIDKAEPDTIAGMFFSPRASADQLAKVRTAIGPDAYGKAAGSYLDNLISQAKDANGVFSPDKVLQILNRHDPGTLQAIFGSNVNGQKLVTKMFERNPTELINAINGKEGDAILRYVVPKGGGVQGISELRQLLPSAQFDQFGGAFLKNLVEKSTGNTGEFSLERFLTNVNGPNGYSTSQMRYLLGGQYGSFRELTDLFARMAKNNRFSANPSGTAQGVLSSFQVGGAIALAANVGGSMLAGTETPTKGLEQLGAGMAIISPSLIAKAIYSPGGIRWLTQGFKAPPGSAAAKTAIANLSKVLASNAMGMVPSVNRGTGTEPPEQPTRESVINPKGDQKKDAMKALAK